MRFKKPRCVLVYALAPEGVNGAEANQKINAFVADPALPLVLFHDHFIETKGGIAIFFVASTAERDALAQTIHLAGWQVDMRPLIYSYNPAAFDAQISYTLSQYRGASWDTLRQDKRLAYGNPSRETAQAEE